MADRSEKITLAGTEYTVHPFNLGELEKLTEKVEEGLSATKLAFAILRIVLARAEPKVEGQIDELEITMAEIENMQPALLRMAGMEAKANPPQAPASGAA